MKWLHVFIFIPLALAITAATNGSACGEAQLKGNRYYGAMRAALKAHAIQLSDVERAIRSEEPYDPFKFVTPERHQIIAKNLFAALAQDPEVRAQWSETQGLLARLLRQEHDQEDVRLEAEHATRKVIAPRELYTFDATLDQEELAFTRLPDGRDVFAHFPKSDSVCDLVTVTTAEGKDILSEHLPRPHGKQTNLWKLGWHRDAEGTLWLYSSSSIPGPEGYLNVHVYRLRWGTKEFQPVEIPALSTKPARFRSVGPYMFLVTSDLKRFDVSTPTAKRVDHSVLPSAQALALDRDGNVVTRTDGERDGGVEIVYTDRQGDTYRFSGKYAALHYEAPGSRAWLPLNLKTPRSFQLLATETAEGRLLLAQITNGDRALGEGLLRVYAPKEQPDNLLFTGEFEGVSEKPNMQWLRGPRGEWLVGVPGKGELYFADPIARTMTSLPLPAGSAFGGWFTQEERTLYWVKKGSDISIFDLIREGPR